MKPVKKTKKQKIPETKNKSPIKKKKIQAKAPIEPKKTSSKKISSSIKKVETLSTRKEKFPIEKEIVPKRDIFELIQDNDLIESANYLNKKNPKLFSEHPNFSDKTLAEEFIKEKIKDFFQNKYKDLSYRISSLRKKGVDTAIEDFYMMSIPLKLKLFLSNYSFDDLSKLEIKMEKISQQVSKLESENSNIKS
jgi:hypothetical protein